MKSKREREEPCHICGHYHDYEGGEPCSICGHRLVSTEDSKAPLTSAFPSEIIQDFLFLGSFDNAARAELLRAMGMRYILNCVPTCQVLYKNSFTYHTASASPPPLMECIEFIEVARKDNAKILVHCMTGISRSPSVVIAYLMKLRSWRLVDSIKWVKERRPCVELNCEALQQLIEMEIATFGSATMGLDGNPIMAASTSSGSAGPWGDSTFQAPAAPVFSFGQGQPQDPQQQQQLQQQQQQQQPFAFGPGGAAAAGGSFVFGAAAPQQQQQQQFQPPHQGHDCAMDE